MPERILLLQLKRIGDAILTAPATSLLRENLPDAHLTLVLSGASSQLGEAFHAVDEVLSYRTGGLNLKLWWRIVTGRFDTCLDFSGNDRAALMTRLTRSPARLGYRKFTEGKRLRYGAFTGLCDAPVRDLHTVDFHRALAEMATGIPSSASNSGFHVPENAHAVSASLQLNLVEPYAVIHPGTARMEKYWPAQRWARVIEYLQETHGIPCVLTGSLDDAREAAHLREIETHCTTGTRNLAGRLPLLDVAAVIGGSTIALGVDSAAMHLAAMLGQPQIVLFGPTNPFHWRPRHENASVLLAGDLSLNVRHFQPKHQPALMTDLSTNQVCRAIDARLATV